jgi:hypothetical protein
MSDKKPFPAQAVFTNKPTVGFEYVDGWGIYQAVANSEEELEAYKKDGCVIDPHKVKKSN